MLRAIIAAAVLALAAGTASAESWSKTYDVGSGAALQLATDDASVRVLGWDQPRIQIDVEAEGWKIGPHDLRLTESQAGGRVSFELREPAFEFHFFDLGRRGVHIEVHAPVKAALDLHTGDGNVYCEGLGGPATIKTGDGNITVAGLAGDIQLHTGDGRVDARDMDGALTATTGDGRVRLQGRFDDLDVSTSDGGVTIEVAPGSRLRDTWHVRTGDGPVVLRLPPDLKADLDAHTGDGGLTVDVPITTIGKIHDNDLRGTLNGGGPDFHIRTGDGSIVIEPYDGDAAAAAPKADWNDKVTGTRHGVHPVKPLHH